MCILTRFFYLLVPIVRFRAFLIRKHLGGCSSCQKRWGTDQRMQAFFEKPDWIAKEESLWPRVQTKILSTASKRSRPGRREKTSLFPSWQWVTAGFALLILIGISYWIYKKGAPGITESEASLALKNTQVHIIHAEIQGKKARPYIYQTSENLYIWFDEMHQEED